MKRSVEKGLFVVLVAGLALGSSLTGASAFECPRLQSPAGGDIAIPDLKRFLRGAGIEVRSG